MRYAPIWLKDGNRLFFPYKEYSAKTEWKAVKISVGMFPEMILLGVTFTGEILHIDTENTPHIRYKLGHLMASIISGPLFDEAKDNANLPTP